MNVPSRPGARTKKQHARVVIEEGSHVGRDVDGEHLRQYRRALYLDPGDAPDAATGAVRADQVAAPHLLRRAVTTDRRGYAVIVLRVVDQRLADVDVGSERAHPVREDRLEHVLRDVRRVGRADRSEARRRPLLAGQVETAVDQPGHALAPRDAALVGRRRRQLIDRVGDAEPSIDLHAVRLDDMRRWMDMQSRAALDEAMGEPDRGRDRRREQSRRPGTDDQQIDCVALGHGSPITSLPSTPMRDTSTSIRSPAFIHNGGMRRAPTPPGVPVAITSPGASGVHCEM